MNIPCKTLLRSVICTTVTFTIFVSPALAGMHRFKGPGFHMVLDDSCTARDQNDVSVWIDCAPDGKMVSFFVHQFWTHDLPKTAIPPSGMVDLAALAKRETQLVLKDTVWETLVDRLSFFGEFRVGNRLFASDGFLCPTSPEPALCWGKADKAIRLKVIQATSPGTIVLFAMGDLIEEQVPMGKSTVTRKGFPETTLAMVESFTNIPN